MAHYAVTAIGEDRPGIVAALTGTLFDLGGNLEDVSSTILRGSFAMMMVVNAPAETGADHIEEALSESAGPLGVSVTVRDVEAGTPHRPDSTHALVIYGSDQPGIVARISRLCADREANITDLSCRLVGEESPVYAMVAELALPKGVDPDAFARELHTLADEVGVDASFRAVDVETL